MMYASLSSAGSFLGKEFHEAISAVWLKSQQDVETICSVAEKLFKNRSFQLLAATSSTYLILVGSGLTTSEALNKKILTFGPQLLAGLIFSQPVICKTAQDLTSRSLRDLLSPN